MKLNLNKYKLDSVKNGYVIIKKNIIEITVLIIYSVLLAIIMYFHEPWLDEAQSWMIARDATITELFKSITHYEGHPPLWFLILMPLAKSGIPFEIGLKLVNFIIINISIALLVFKAPFSRFYRCTIPFTYFFFYQYGVISRSYSLMMLGFMLSALFFKSRNENPYKLAASLMIMCSTSAYGIVISFGIVIVWIYENISIFKLNLSRNFFEAKANRKLLISWTLLLVLNILLLISIYPLKDTFAIEAYEQSNISISKIVYMFLAAPMEALFADIINTEDKISNFYYVFNFMGGYLFSVFLLCQTIKYKKFGLFLIPYILFLVFASSVYFSSHHFGIVALFYVFVIWCCLDENSNNISHIKIFRQHINQKLWRRFTKAILLISVLASIYCSINASIYDINNNYGNGKETYEFIKKYNLEKLNIYVAWYPISEDHSGNDIYDFNLICGLPALAYFDENIFCNFNDKSNDKGYLLHKVNSDSEHIKKLMISKKPEVLLISDRISYTFGDYINIDDFALVKIIKANMIWKNSNDEFSDFIYIKRDLLKNYPALKEIEKN